MPTFRRCRIEISNFCAEHHDVLAAAWPADPCRCHDRRDSEDNRLSRCRVRSRVRHVPWRQARRYRRTQTLRGAVMTTGLKYLAFTAILRASLWIPYVVAQVRTNGPLAPAN